jgi:two-component system sensor histidine kinase PilS (NtrC family)
MRDGVYLGGIFTLFDLTEEKRLGRLLLRQEKMAALGQMSARIAHEIRNPLASISGAAQMLRDAAVASEADQKLLKLIVGESNRLNRFLGDLMDYVRERPPTFRRASLKALIRRLLPLLEKSPAFRSGLVTLEEKMENGDVEIVTDQDILMQVLLNVGLNALEAMESRGGTLTVSAARTVDGARIEVSDTGPGMDTAILARAADPFFTTKPQGTGLGLAVCFHVMQTLQGNINLSSVQGRGTVVSLQLPSEPKHGGNLTDGN